MITEHQYNDALDTLESFKKAKSIIIELFPNGINGEKLTKVELQDAQERLSELMEETFYHILRQAQMTIEMSARSETRANENEHRTY